MSPRLSTAISAALDGLRTTLGSMRAPLEQIRTGAPDITPFQHNQGAISRGTPPLTVAFMLIRPQAPSLRCSNLVDHKCGPAKPFFGLFSAVLRVRKDMHFRRRYLSSRWPSLPYPAYCAVISN